MIYNFQDYQKRSGETAEEYLLRIARDKDKIGTWEDVAQILNAELDDTKDESTYRKKYYSLVNRQQTQNLEESITSPAVEKDDDDIRNKLARLRLEEQNLYRQKTKFRDERNELNKLLRREARHEELIEMLTSSLAAIGQARYIPRDVIGHEDGAVIVACLSDLHIGLEFNHPFDKPFNLDVARKRMSKYADKIQEIGKQHNVTRVIVVGLGDYISGSCHHTISIANQENVVEQIKHACEMVADFLFELSQHFSRVELYAVSGNHSRLTKKEDALTDERVDLLIPWYASKLLKHVSNIEIHDNNRDRTYYDFEIISSHLSGQYTAMKNRKSARYVAVHGDYDGMTEGAISKLVLWLGFRPDVILMGHKHFPAMTEVSGITVIQSGSLCGSGDDYTREKRLTGKPSQTVQVLNSDCEIEAMYPVSLNI